MEIVTAILGALRMAFDVLGDPMGIDLGFLIIRRRSGRGFEIRDKPALGRRFAENAEHRDCPRRGIVFVFLCRGRTCSINFSQRRQFHGGNGFRAGFHKSCGRTRDHNDRSVMHQPPRQR